MLAFFSSFNDAFNNPDSPLYYVVGGIFLILVIASVVVYTVFSKKKNGNTGDDVQNDADANAVKNHDATATQTVEQGEAAEEVNADSSQTEESVVPTVSSSLTEEKNDKTEESGDKISESSQTETTESVDEEVATSAAVAVEEQSVVENDDKTEALIAEPNTEYTAKTEIVGDAIVAQTEQKPVDAEPETESVAEQSNEPKAEEKKTTAKKSTSKTAAAKSTTAKKTTSKSTSGSTAKKTTTTKKAVEKTSETVDGAEVVEKAEEPKTDDAVKAGEPVTTEPTEEKKTTAKKSTSKTTATKSTTAKKTTSKSASGSAAKKTEKPFIEKILSTKEIHGTYNEVKNVLLSYTGIKAKLTKESEEFFVGDDKKAILSLDGKSIVLSLSVPKEKVPSQFAVVDGKELPTAMTVGDSDVDTARRLINFAMNVALLARNEKHRHVDYVQRAIDAKNRAKKK